MRPLRARGVAFRCLLVGDGPERPRLEAQVAANGLRGHVELLGARPHDEVRAVLSLADVVVHPSVTTPEGMMDGIPVALMEAMAMGCPVVSTRVSGIPELVEDERSGLLVDPRDGAQLADAIARLLADPALRHRLATAGRRAVLRSFTLEDNARRLLGHFEAWAGVRVARDAATRGGPGEVEPAGAPGDEAFPAA